LFDYSCRRTNGPDWLLHEDKSTVASEYSSSAVKASAERLNSGNGNKL